jgi:hypothetical protein
MAKTIKDMNKPTRKPSQVTEQTQETESKNYPVSVYLPEHERLYIEKIAEQLGVSRHAVMQYGLKYFIAQHRAGAVEVPVETKTLTEIQNP